MSDHIQLGLVNMHEQTGSIQRKGNDICNKINSPYYIAAEVQCSNRMGKIVSSLNLRTETILSVFCLHWMYCMCWDTIQTSALDPKKISKEGQKEQAESSQQDLACHACNKADAVGDKKCPDFTKQYTIRYNGYSQAHSWPLETIARLL